MPNLEGRGQLGGPGVREMAPRSDIAPAKKNVPERTDEALRSQSRFPVQGPFLEDIEVGHSENPHE